MYKPDHTLDEVKSFITNRVKEGYSYIQIRKGALGVGDVVLLAPEGQKWNYFIQEMSATFYKASYSVRRRAKLSSAIMEKVEATLNSENLEVLS